MDTILNFFSNLILFTAGLAVATLWLLIIFVVIDETIDIGVALRNRNKTSEEDES